MRPGVAFAVRTLETKLTEMFDRRDRMRAQQLATDEAIRLLDREAGEIHEAIRILQGDTR